MKDLDEIVGKLSKISLFSQIKEDIEKLKIVANYLEPIRFLKGEKLIVEGDTGDTLFILKSGEVLISKKTLEDEEYTIVTLADFMNVFFGELALLDNDKRSASITAITECEVWSLSRADFEKLGEENPVLGLLITREIAKILAGRLRKTSTDVITLFEALVSEVEERDGLK